MNEAEARRLLQEQTKASSDIYLHDLVLDDGAVSLGFIRTLCDMSKLQSFIYSPAFQGDGIGPFHDYIGSLIYSKKLHDKGSLLAELFDGSLILIF